MSRSKPGSCLDGRRYQEGLGANGFIQVNDPAFGALAVARFRCRVPSVIGGDLLQHPLQGALGERQQDPEQQTHLWECQPWSFF